MRRREFITMLAGGTPLGAWSLAARAQQPGKPPTIGFLGPSSAETWSQWTKAFVDRLGELGWVDGRTVNIVYRWGHGHIDRFGVIAAELVNLKVDLILTAGSATLQAKKETSEDSHCVRAGQRAGCHRHGGELGAAGRQRYWPLA